MSQKETLNTFDGYNNEFNLSNINKISFIEKNPYVPDNKLRKDVYNTCVNFNNNYKNIDSSDLELSKKILNTKSKINKLEARHKLQKLSNEYINFLIKIRVCLLQKI